MKKIASTFILALLFCIPANAQFHVQRIDTLHKIYDSGPGTQPARIFTDGSESGDISRLDFNGDGKPELVLTSEDIEGNLLGILVVDLAAMDTLWRVQDVHQTLGLNDIFPVFFFGFADPFGNGVRHAIFANEQDVRLFDPSDNSLKWAYSVQIPSEFPVLLLAATDVTGDEFEELIIFLPGPRQVQVWGHQ